MMTQQRKTYFDSERYSGPRGAHLNEMRRRQFGKTPVNDRIEAALKDNRGLDVMEMCFGDPPRYPGMGPYEGVHRFLRRYLNFHDNPVACASYSIWGDPQFIAQMKRSSAYDEDRILEVPDHVAVYPTDGVSGALRMTCPAILLPPGPDGVRDNVVVPKWTYLSHSAEAVFSLADVRSCRLDDDGQVDLDHMFSVMDRNTQAVILATVGNPLSAAMHPAVFDEMLCRLDARMAEFNHPIVLIADTIYEQFRHNRAERIDAIQRTLRLGLEVPVIETSSFSKMMGMPGYRLGFYRAYWMKGGAFRDERHDFFTALNTVYGTSLCPVPNILQKAVGSLYVAINSRQPVEEELAPLAAVLTSLKDLTERHGGGDTHTMMPDAVPRTIVQRLGLDPDIWFTSSAVAKRTSKIARGELGKYTIDMDSSRMEDMASKLIEGGYTEKVEMLVKRETMMDILTSAVLEHGRVEHRLIAGAMKAVKALGLSISESEIKQLVKIQLDHLMAQLGVDMDASLADMEEIESSFDVAEKEQSGELVRTVFYRLKNPAEVPDLEWSSDAKIMLEEISSDYAWVRVGNRCGLPTEDALYEEHKRTRRERCHERTAYFVNEIDTMGQEGLGVYLHPAYYDKEGHLIPERLNAFYVLFGFEKLSNHECQAAELVSRCKEFGLPLMMFTPGEVFLPPGDREPGDSYIRAVTLDDLERMDEVLSVIRKVANYLGKGEHIPYRAGGRLPGGTEQAPQRPEAPSCNEFVKDHNPGPQGPEGSPGDKK